MYVLMTTTTRQVGEALLLDLAFIGILAFGIFYRRYRRPDLALAYVTINVSLFALAVLIVNQSRFGVAFGFGLFAILSIIRLRSEQVSPEEGAYYFATLALGLINGMQYQHTSLARLLDVGIVGVISLLDNHWVMPRTRHQIITLDRVFSDDDLLRADLEHRLGAELKHVTVRETDYVRDTMLVDVRYLPFIRPRRTDGIADPGSERDSHVVVA